MKLKHAQGTNTGQTASNNDGTMIVITSNSFYASFMGYFDSNGSEIVLAIFLWL